MYRRITALSLILVLPIVAGCAKNTAKKETVPVMVTQVSSPAADGSSHIYSGTIEPATTLPVSFTVGGYIKEILNFPGPGGQLRLVQQGDRVLKGTVLAHVRDVDYTAIVNQASAQVAGKAALTEQAQYGLQQAQATMDRASSGISEANAARDQAKTGYSQAKSGLAAAESQLVEAQATSQAADALVEQAEAGKEKAEADFSRADRLYATKSLTRSDYDAAKAQLKVAEAQVKAAKEQVNVAHTKIEQARVQIEANKSRMDQTKAIIAQTEAVITSAKAQRRAASAAVHGARAQVDASAAGTRAARAQLIQAQTPLGDASLKAPMDGIVLKRNVELGALVGPGTPGFVLADDSTVKVMFGVPDIALSQMRVGNTVDIVTQAYENRHFTGKITAISPAADARSHVFQVEVSVPNQGRALKVGMIAKVELGKAKVVSSIAVVPLSAVVRSPRNNESYAVFVVQNEGKKTVVHAREITLGETLGNTIAVKSGLSVGDRVVSNGSTLINDGDTVSIVE